MSRIRTGMSLIELIVAMTILSVGVLGLAGAATYAQRSFGSADAIERGVHAAAAVLDSLMRVERPAGGQRRDGQVDLQWDVLAGAGGVTPITLTARVADGAGYRTLTFHAVHSGRFAR